jgi:hypothetical protein
MFILDFHYWRFTPRQTRLKPTTLGKTPRGGWFWGLLFLVGMGCAAFAISDALREWQYRFQGVALQGTVLQCEEQPLDDNRYYAVRLDYQYQVAGTIYTGREDLTSTEQNRCSDLMQRQGIPLIYLAFDPDQSVFYTYRWRYFDQLEIWTIRIAALLLVGLSGWYLWQHRQFYRRLHRLNQQAILLPGVITWADALPDTRDGYRVLFDYLFINPGGYEITASTSGYLRDSRPFGLPRPGLIVSVLYAGDDCYVVL